MLLAALVLLFAFFPIPALCGEASLGEITVHPPRSTDRTSFDPTLSATVIEAQDLEGRRATLPEVLSENVGIQIRRYGGLDDFATVSLRGSSSQQVAVFVDGLLLNPAEGGGVNLAEIPADQIERIEIYRGAVPARLGTSAMGGAVLIQTKKTTRERTTRLTGSYGSFNTLETDLFQSQTFKPLGYAVDYHFLRSDGDFPFEDDNGTPLNLSDDTIEARKNNELARHNLLLKLSRPIAAGTVDFQENFLREDRGIPGLGTLTSDRAALSKTGSQTRVDWNRGPFNVAPFFEYQKQQFSDPDGEVGLGVQANDNDTYTYGLHAATSLLAGIHQRITLAAEYRGEQFLPEDFGTQGPDSRRDQGSFGVEDEIVLWGERLILSPSLRTEHLVNQFEGEDSSAHPVSGKLGLRYLPIPPITLKTNFARAYRLPNFAELFGDRGSLVGNPDLSPEKGWNWDIGASLKTDFVRAEAVYFLNRVTDLIQFLQTSQFTAQAQNLRAARIQGAETTLFLPLGGYLEVSGNYTFQWAKDTSGLPGTDGRFLPGRPRHEATGRLSLFNRRGRVFADLTFIDGNFLDTQNILRVGNRTLAGAGLSFKPVKKVTTSFEAKNLLNDRVVDVVGFPLPGRSFYGKVELSI